VAKILLIEDDPVAADVLEALMRRMGHEIERADNGVQGVALFSAVRHDVVVVDLLMPGKPGLEALLDIRQLSPTVKLIAISGGSPVQPAHGALSSAPCMGADATLSKPFSGAELAETIARVLEPVR
jgi:CheY-like chemotaxis protein